MAKSNEPIMWSLFSAGGMVTAFFVPVTIVLTSIVVPAGWIEVENFRQLIAHLLTRLFLFVLISLALFHWAHRFRYALVDLGLRNSAGLLAITCYATAVVGTIMAGFFLVSP